MALIDRCRASLEQPSDKARECVPLLRVQIHILIALEQEHFAFSGAWYDDSERNFELVQDRCIHLGILHDWPRVLIELHSQFEQLHCYFALNVLVQWLILHIPDRCSQTFDLVGDDVLELGWQSVFRDQVLHIHRDLVKHAKLFLSQRLIRSLEKPQLLKQFGNERNGQVARILHGDQRPGDLDQVPIVYSLLFYASAREHILFKSKNKCKEELVLLVRTQEPIFDKHDEDLAHRCEVTWCHLEIARLKSSDNVVKEYLDFLGLKKRDKMDKFTQLVQRESPDVNFVLPQALNCLLNKH